MPFPMKIQPIDIDYHKSKDDSEKPVLKTRLKRLFDRQFRISSAADKPSPAGGEAVYGKGGGVAAEFEPSSVCLDKLVRNFIEDSSENKHSTRNRCTNCFNGNNIDTSDDELDVDGGSFGDACDWLKSFVACASVAERNLLADTAKIVEKNRNQKQRKEDLRKMVTEALSSLGYDSSTCKSKWDKSHSFPAGEYEYIDVITAQGERLLIDIDFRSEFEMARSTATYKEVLQSLPHIFVGKPDRLQQIVSVVSEAAKQSLKRKGMHLPPWRKVEYMRAKWLSPYTRAVSVEEQNVPIESEETEVSDSVWESELIFPSEKKSGIVLSSEHENSGENKVAPAVVMTWQPPAVKPKSVDRRGKIVTGLASLLREKP